MIWLAAITLLFLLAFAIESSIGGLRMRALRDAPAEGSDWPRVSIVVAGRNEELSVEEATRSLLALDYPDFEVVSVDDRSTDGTGEILRRLAAEDPRLRPVTIRELPPGWLGKNHALHRGASEATGELILFTDADVVFEPSTLRRAVRFMRDRRLDHLTASPEMIAPSAIVGIFVVSFGFFFSIFSRPWRAPNRSPRDHVGVGAFNLVRASFYREHGGHQPIRMRPDDDMKLAKHLKANGARAELAFGTGLMRVVWYRTMGEAIRGLEKNAFSGVEYSTLRLVAATIEAVFLFLWPFVAVFATDGPTRWLYLACCALLLGLVAGMALRSGAGHVAYALAFPFGAAMFLYILWRASLITLRNGGIDWRGTFYSLDELRANKV
ncbi:MAG TPA: glycosyltransferase family 2 protein [Thermoanaerobaculia bacterium]